MSNKAKADEVWTVLVWKHDDNLPCKMLGANSQRAAERIERGLNINLNHADYYTEIVPPTGAPDA